MELILLMHFRFCFSGKWLKFNHKLLFYIYLNSLLFLSFNLPTVVSRNKDMSISIYLLSKFVPLSESHFETVGATQGEKQAPKYHDFTLWKHESNKGWIDMSSISKLSIFKKIMSLK